MRALPRHSPENQDQSIQPALSGWRRTVLLLLAFACAIFSPCAASSLPAELILFQPRSYLGAIERSGFYGFYPQLMLDLLSSGGNLFVPGLGNLLIATLPPAQADQALRFLFPEDWVRGQTSTVLEEFWGYFNGSASHLDLRVDFRPVKRRLNGEDALALVHLSIQSWPACTAQDVLQIGLLTLQGKTGDLPQCKPPQELEGSFESALHLGLQSLGSSLPDDVWLAPRLDRPLSGFSLVLRWLVRLAPVFWLVLCLAAACLLGFRPRAFAAWAGLPLYCGGLSGALLAALAGWWAYTSLPGLGAVLPPAARALYTFSAALLTAVLIQTLLWIAILGLALALTGLVFFLLARVDAVV